MMPEPPRNHKRRIGHSRSPLSLITDTSTTNEGMAGAAEIQFAIEVGVPGSPSPAGFHQKQDSGAAQGAGLGTSGS